MIKAIFLDRDGTLNKDLGYVHKVEDLEILPFVKDGLRLLQEEGYKFIILSNQSGINRGYFTIQDMAIFNAEICNRLNGIRFSKIYFCPHKPDEHCRCRKPEILNMQKAAFEFKIDLPKSWVVGDSTCDVKLAENVKAKSVLLLTGRAGKDHEYLSRPTYISENLLDAARRIISHDNNQNTS